MGPGGKKALAPVRRGKGFGAAAAIILFLSCDAAAAPALHAGGLYCMNKGAKALAAKNLPNGDLQFNMTLWGSRAVLISGIAHRKDGGWEFSEKLDSPNDRERCKLHITRRADGTFLLQSDREANCTNYNITSLAVVEFPESAYFKPITNEFEMEGGRVAENCPDT